MHQLPLHQSVTNVIYGFWGFGARVNCEPDLIGRASKWGHRAAFPLRAAMGKATFSPATTIGRQQSWRGEKLYLRIISLWFTTSFQHPRTSDHSRHRDDWMAKTSQ
jgi:hypothetical protein